MKWKNFNKKQPKENKAIICYIPDYCDVPFPGKYKKGKIIDLEFVKDKVVIYPEGYEIKWIYVDKLKVK